MAYSIKQAAVIGAGVMGAGIAAHLANVGIPVLLLDIVPPSLTPDEEKRGLTLQRPEVRNRFATQGLQKALTAKPAAFYSKRNAKYIRTGNTEDNWEELAQVDWIIEVVIEQLDIKQQLFARLEQIRKADAIVTSNTSGLPAHMLMEGRSEEFRKHFLITHFFNPVRYMRLLELVPDRYTNSALMAFMDDFCSKTLGKGTVVCKDTPNFIANRIGTLGFMAALHRMLADGYKVEEVDAILGPAIGRPKSAAFRTADLAGIDTIVHVADNLYENLPMDESRDAFKIPPFVRTMVEHKWLGDKTGQGFYKKEKDTAGKSVIYSIDPATLEYRLQDSVHFTSLDTARNAADPVQKVKTVINSADRAGIFAWKTLSDVLVYSAIHASEIADSIYAIDNAMRWGFNWDLGPFETWDALGVDSLVKRLEGEQREVPALVKEVQAAGGTFYRWEAGNRQYYDFESKSYKDIPGQGTQISLVQLKRGSKVVKENKGASLIDVGDGVACLEFHTKMNAIDDDIIKMIHMSLEEVQANFRGLVVGNEAENFSVGANLVQILMGSKMRQWPLIEKAARGFQDANMALKYAAKPVVIAPSGRALGGGCEIILHGHQVRAHAESYIGLVELGVGLIPAGGGCKEMLVRWTTTDKEGGPFPAVRHAFEIVGVATVGTSAAEAMDYKFLRPADKITLNRDMLLQDARNDVLALADAQDKGMWQPPEPAKMHLPGPGGRLVMEQQMENLVLAGKISEHDAIVGGKLAYILCGGECSPLQEMSEQDVLDLEREAFLSLCGMPKTQERMQFMLQTGKPLRN